MNPRLRTAKSGGFTMVELLVTMLLLAISMTGLAALQIHTIRQTSASRRSGEAVRLAQYAIEKHLAGPIPTVTAPDWVLEFNKNNQMMSGAAADGSLPGPYSVHRMVQSNGAATPLTQTLITIRVTYRDVDGKGAANPRTVFLTTMRTP